MIPIEDPRPRSSARAWSRRAAGRRARALVLALLAAIPIVAPAAGPLRVGAEQQRALGIETEPLRPSPSSRIDGLAAQVVVPNPQVRVVSAPLGGLVEQVFVSTQEPVRRGQLLARLQSPALADAQHTFLQAATRVELENSNLRRDEELFRAGVLPERTLLATRAAYNEVSVDLAERLQVLRLAGMSDAGIDALRSGRRVGTTIDLFAPIDGVVIEQIALLGQRVEAAAPLMRVARLDPLWLEVQVPVARLPVVASGARVEVPAFDAEATVIAIGRNVSASTQTAMVRAEIRRGAARLRPGQFVEASVSGAPAPGHWDVPNVAIARVAGQAHVFVRTGSGFDPRRIRVVAEGAQRSLVAGELRAGDEVVVRGVAALKASLMGIGGE